MEFGASGLRCRVFGIRGPRTSRKLNLMTPQAPGHSCSQSQQTCREAGQFKAINSNQEQARTKKRLLVEILHPEPLHCSVSVVGMQEPVIVGAGIRYIIFC